MKHLLLKEEPFTRESDSELCTWQIILFDSLLNLLLTCLVWGFEFFWENLFLALPSMGVVVFWKLLGFGWKLLFRLKLVGLRTTAFKFKVTVPGFTSSKGKVPILFAFKISPGVSNMGNW